MKSNAWRLTASLAFACGGLAASQASAAITATVLSSMPQLVTGEDALVKVAGATAAPTVTVEGTGRFGGVQGRRLGQLHRSGHWPQGRQQRAGRQGRHRPGNADAGRSRDQRHAVRRPAAEAVPVRERNLRSCTGDGCDPAPRRPSSAISTWPRPATGSRSTPTARVPATSRPPRPATARWCREIVRQEKGVINRAAYIINILHDPAAGPAPTPLSRGGSAWNGKLIYGFGPGVGAGYHMGRNVGLGSRSATSVHRQYRHRARLRDRPRARSTCSATSRATSSPPRPCPRSRSTSSRSSASPIYTAGQGASGGSMQQQLISQRLSGPARRASCRSRSSPTR